MATDKEALWKADKEKKAMKLKKDPYILLAELSREIKILDNIIFEYRAEYAITDKWDELLSDLSEAMARLSTVKERLKRFDTEEK